MGTIEKGFGGRGQSVFIVTTVTFILATIFVVARLISRFGIVKNRAADDWCIMLTWFIALGLSFSIDYGTFTGLGRRDADIPETWFRPLRRSQYAFNILYYPAIMACKTSILIFYLRIAKDTQKLLRIASYITLAIVNISGIVVMFINAFRCSPASAAWALGRRQCKSIVKIYLCSAPVNIITDLAILVLPIPVLTGIQIPRRQKTVLIFTFALGTFATIVGVIRIYYLQETGLSLVETRTAPEVDFTYKVSIAYTWSAVEVNVGIICACIPTLKPLIHRILPSILTYQSKYGSEKSKPTPGSRTQIGQNARSRESSTIGNDVPLVQSLPPHQQGVHREDSMSMMNFLTSTGAGRDVEGAQSASTPITDESVHHFGFIDIKRPKSMLRTKGGEAVMYCTVVTILFFLWGFSYGLLNTLNFEISQVAHESTSQTLSLSTVYFSAYLFGPLTLGQWMLRHGGFKATFICGLCIYGTGTLIFWPSAILRSYPGFIVCSFVVGFGLSTLETVANPFIALCGPSQYAGFRLLLAQGVQGVSSVLSLLLAQRILFTNIIDHPSLIDTQWTYLAIALFTVVLALFFYYMPLPEASDIDLQLQSDDIGVYPTTPSIVGPRIPLIYLTLALAVFSQFLYVAAQECMSEWFGELLAGLSYPRTSTHLTVSIDSYSLLSRTAFATSRFMFAPLCLIIRPRILLLVTFCGCIILATLIMALDLNANAIAAPIIVYFFFQGPVWPLLFTIALRGMGKQTKLAAAFLTACGSGGAPFPFIQLAIINSRARSTQYSFVVVVALFAAGIIFPIYLNLVPGARRQVDPIKHSSLGEDRHSRNGRGPSNQQPGGLGRRLSKSFRAVVSQIRGSMSATTRKSSQEPIAQHRESREIAGSNVPSDTVTPSRPLSNIRPSTQSASLPPNESSVHSRPTTSSTFDQAPFPSQRTSNALPGE